MFGEITIFYAVGCSRGIGIDDGAARSLARSLARADFAASICAFKLGFAINYMPLPTAV
jgi:hypothetical protein